MIKRVFDFTFSLFGIILSLPIWLMITLAILIEDGWPVLYSQERMGKDCRTFKAFKFRSMVKDAEKHTGPIQAKEDDRRVTKVGKVLRSLAMDQLPQLINILRGDISFVGPRALRSEEIEVADNVLKKALDYPYFEERSRIRPGLTGVAQVFAPRDISRKEKFGYDAWYIRNQNFRLDIYIIILSFLVTFRGKWELRKSKFNYLGRSLKELIQSRLGAS